MLRMLSKKESKAVQNYFLSIYFEDGVTERSSE